MMFQASNYKERNFLDLKNNKGENIQSDVHKRRSIAEILWSFEFIIYMDHKIDY